MKNRRLKQFILSLSVVLSLLASSVSAAHYCSHHEQKNEENQVASCHQMMNDAENAQVSASDEAACVDVGCHCFVKTSQPFVVSKSETVKTQKNLAVLPLAIETEKTSLAAQIAPVKSHFERHFYNSNYLRKLLPARAPPVS